VIRPTLRRSRWVLVAGLAMAGLAACTPAKAGSAAIVGDSSLSQATVNQKALEVLHVVDQSGQPAPDIATVNQSIVSSWVTQHLLARVAAAHHVVVTDAEVSDFLDKVRQQSGGQDKLEQTAASQGGTPPEAIPDLVKYYLISQKLPAVLLPGATATEQNVALAKAVIDEAARLGVHVNPRYGQWDPKSGKIQSGLGELSVPATAIDGRPILTPGNSGGAGTLPAP